MIDHSKMRLGKKKAQQDNRTLRLARYLAPGLTAPARANWRGPVTRLGMMANDRLGDCTCAAAGHMIQTWTANAGRQVIAPDGEIVAAYSAITGYTPADPSTDQGAVELDVLNYWRRTGIGGHRILAYAAQNPRSRQHVELAVALFGGCYLGLALPVSAQNQKIWDVPAGGPVGDGEPGSWGGHAVPIVDYGQIGPTCITWGKYVRMTWAFFVAYCDEAYCVFSSDWLSQSGRAPSGLNLPALQRDLSLIAH